MSAPGFFILGLRLGRNQSRLEVALGTRIEAERQRAVEEGLEIPTLEERRAYARHFGFSAVTEFDDAWRAKRLVLSRGDVLGRIPVINLAPAGEPQDYHECYPNSGVGYAYIDPPLGVSGPNLFAFVIFGDSMEPDYLNGSFAICKPTADDEICDGQPVFVRFGATRNHGCTFKRCFRVSDSHVELRPINPLYESEIVAKVDIDRMSPVVACVAQGADSRGGSAPEDYRDFRYTSENTQCVPDSNPGREE